MIFLHKLLENPLFNEIENLPEKQGKYLSYMRSLPHYSQNFLFDIRGEEGMEVKLDKNIPIELPYPVTYFEILYVRNSRLGVFLHDEGDEIWIYPITYFPDEVPAFMPQFVSINVKKEDWETCNYYTYVKNLWTEEKLKQTYGESFATTILYYLQLLNCSNISYKVIKEPKALNKKRGKKNKPPIFEYKTLNLDTGEKIININDNNEAAEKRNSPRLHLRRGHFRHLQNGKVIFISPMVVGNKTNGMIVKEYAL
jgi:hypothetical protein